METLPTIWYHGGSSYSTIGVNPVNVSAERHKLLQQFLDRDQALNTRHLESKGVNNVSKVIAKLCEQFGQRYIRRPERKNYGYYIHVRSKSATPIS
jgi:hypothetical protein